MSRRRTTISILKISLLLLILIGCSQYEALRTNKDHYKENFQIETKDGWTLNIWHYPPQKRQIRTYPIILCHGLSYNSMFWDLTEEVSLARYLQAAGYDVWSVDLRGAGLSSKPTLSKIKQLFRLNVSILNPIGIKNVPLDLLKINWTVDDHIMYDVPAVIDFVTKKTGSDKIIWIGHSMGGMIMFAYLGTHREDDRIAGFIAIAAPLYLIRPTHDIFELLANQTNFVMLGNIATGANLRAIIGTVAGPAFNTPIDSLFHNTENISPDVLHMLYYLCQEDISPGQLDQLIRFLREGHFKSIDGKVDYTLNISNINENIPILQIVGQLDNMAIPGFVLQIHNMLRSQDKTFRLFGRINNYRADYGHDDIVIGKHSKEEVFPYLLSWLKGHEKALK